MKIAILSDVHANYGALAAVLAHASAEYSDDIKFLQLGDLVNYGPRPNEVVDELRRLTAAGRVLVNLAGNHEAALLGRERERFAHQRGRDALDTTAAQIREDNHVFLREQLSYAPVVFELDGQRVLCVHGSLADLFWGSLRGSETASSAYRDYALVVCGHTHVPCFHEEFFADENPRRRNQRKTMFINPGSVGQPRNHDPRAQYTVWDVGRDAFSFHKIDYDIAAEQACFAADADAFYRSRLEQGL